MNVSEGRDLDTIDAFAARAGADLLDVHHDPDHNRTVLTLVGEAAPRRVAQEAIARLDLRRHVGVHPRFGVVDVVPFVPLATSMAEAIRARNEFASWAGGTLGVPCFLYGPERSLPDVRRGAFHTLGPDAGPAEPHPTAGAIAVGARPVLVAFNVLLQGADLAEARAIARAVRGPHVRALALAVSAGVQVSMNLLDPAVLGPAEAYDLVTQHAPAARAELVGLIPRGVLEAIPRARWAVLDVALDKTIEHRLERRSRGDQAER